ncbi:MAG TPA: hypothetical protein VFC19_24040 [Candidatus Limnocylindrales bacterium]|nr:hypothetical protein [Candidatus Limnocylindrales bacterium]
MVPGSAAAFVCSAIGLWWLSHATESARMRGVLAILAVAAGVSVFAPGLAGPDSDLDRASAFAWPPRRFAHLALAAIAVTGGLAVAQLTGHPFAALGPVARNVAGMVGLLALGAVVLGAHRAWLPPVAWALAVLPLAPPPEPAYKVALTWMIQPAGSGLATLTATLLGLAGTLSYALIGSRR